jgi:hypothetical protein
MRKNKLQIELDKTVKNWTLIETLVKSNKYSLVPIFKEYSSVKLRKIIIPFFEYIDKTIINELKKSTYRDCLQSRIDKLYSKNRYYGISLMAWNSYVELINHHKLKINAELSNRLRVFGEVFYENIDEMKEYLLSNHKYINFATFDMVSEDLTKEQLIELLHLYTNQTNYDYTTHTQYSCSCNCYTEEYNVKNIELINKIKEKISFKDIIESEYFNVSQSIIIHLNDGTEKKTSKLYYNILKLYGIEECLPMLLEKDFNFSINNLNSDKVDKFALTVEQSENLLKKCSFEYLSNYFDIPLTENTFIDILSNTNTNERSIYSDKVNEYILNGKMDELCKNIRNWDSIVFTPETAKIFFKNKKISFKTYRKYISEEEAAVIINKKQELFAYILKRYEITKTITDGCPCGNKGYNKVSRLLDKLSHDYNISPTFILSLMKPEQLQHSGSYLTHSLITFLMY